MTHPLLERSPAPENIKREAEALIDQLADRTAQDAYLCGSDLLTLAINSCNLHSDNESFPDQLASMEDEVDHAEAHSTSLECDIASARDDRAEAKADLENLECKVLAFARAHPESPANETVTAFRELFSEILGRSDRWRSVESKVKFDLHAKEIGR